MVTVPPMEKCLFTYTQTGSTGCGLYTIAFAIDLAARNNPSDIYDQSAIAATFHSVYYKIEYQFFHDVD